jgi:hypothetical protein
MFGFVGSAAWYMLTLGLLVVLIVVWVRLRMRENRRAASWYDDVPPPGPPALPRGTLSVPTPPPWPKSPLPTTRAEQATCPRCAAANHAVARFCSRCGTPMP